MYWWFVSEILICCIWYDGASVYLCLCLWLCFARLIMKDMTENKWWHSLRKAPSISCKLNVAVPKQHQSADHHFLCKSGFRVFSSLGPYSPAPHSYIIAMWASWLTASTTNTRRVVCWNYQQKDVVICPLPSTADTSCQLCFICFPCYKNLGFGASPKVYFCWNKGTLYSCN